MDLEQLRNFSFISTPVSIFFLVISIIAFSNGEIGGIIFLFGAIFMFLPLITYLRRRKKDNRDSGLSEQLFRAMLGYDPGPQIDYKSKSTEKAVPTDTFIELEYLRKQLVIENLNEEYALGLYDGDIYAIARADNPSEALKKFVKPGLPSVEEYQENLSELLHVITHGIGLPDEEADEAEQVMLQIQKEYGEEEIATFADAFSNLMYGDLAFLNGKINYLLCVLAMFTAYANATGNEFWSKKADEIREKRGYANR